MGRIGSNSVSAPLCGRRLPAIFPKRCKAGGQAGSSWVGLLGGGLVRALPVGLAASPGALLSPGVLVGRVLGFERCRSVWRYFLIMEKVEFPPPTPARIRLVLYWILVYSGGYERCRWCSLGVRAVPVGVALFFDNGKG
jgi:hypothetical protein